MINVSEYIKILLIKRKWTLKQFAKKINEVKTQIGIQGKTTEQNISNFLNQVDDSHILRPKQLCIWEKALGLNQGTLSDMVEQPKTKVGIAELNRLKEKIKEI